MHINILAVYLTKLHMPTIQDPLQQLVSIITPNVTTLLHAEIFITWLVYCIKTYLSKT